MFKNQTKISKLSKHYLVLLSCARPISTSQLNTSQYFHLTPINLVVYEGSITNVNLEDGFTLRCFQRLSVPNDSYPAMPLVGQLVHQRFVLSGPLVLGKSLLNILRPQQIGDRQICYILISEMMYCFQYILYIAIQFGLYLP